VTTQYSERKSKLQEAKNASFSHFCIKRREELTIKNIFTDPLKKTAVICCKKIFYVFFLDMNV